MLPLHALPPESAHDLAVACLKTASTPVILPLLRATYAQRLPAHPTSLFGKKAPNPIGIAAGFDKNARFTPALFALGFGMVEVGTVTPHPQPGNPSPRMFRIPSQQALINRLGFNNLGLAHMTKQLQLLRQQKLHGIIGVNIGKNLQTPLSQAHQDYITCLKGLHAHTDYIVVNLSSPNTPGLRQLLQPQALSALALACSTERNRLADAQGFSTPLLLKLSPDLPLSALAPIVDTLLQYNWQGLIAANTTTARPQNLPPTLSRQSGGFSGPYLFSQALKMMQKLRSIAGKDLTLIGCGGISNPKQLQTMLSQGANAVQLYTAFTYQGPALLPRLLRCWQHT